MMTVADMIRGRVEVYCICSSSTACEAACYLREKSVRAATVCDPQGKPVGVLSQSDISDKVVSENRLPDTVNVAEIMSKDLITVTPESTLNDCLRLVGQHRIYHLLVLGKDGRLHGMISAQDLLKALADDERERADVLEAWSFPSR